MNSTPASLHRKLAAMLYDSLLIVALLFFAALPATMLNGGAIRQDGSIQYFIFILYLLLIWFLYFGWCWTHGGQTLGMLAWHIKATGIDDKPVSWRAALIRWCSACLGLGNLAGLFSKERAGWHERLSATRTVNTPVP